MSSRLSRSLAALGVSVLVALGGAAEADSMDALHDAIRRGDVDGVRRALGNGADPNLLHRRSVALDELPTPSAEAREIAGLLIEAGARLEGTRYGPPSGIVVAAADALPQLVEQLLAMGVSADTVSILPNTRVGAKRFTPLQVAIYVSGTEFDPESREVYRALALRMIEAGADPMANTREETALHLAARSCLPDVVSALLRAGADPDATEHYNKRTPLFDAVDGFCAEAVAPLARGGATIDARDSGRRRPLDLVLRREVLAREDVELARELVAAGAQVPEGLGELVLPLNRNRVAGAELLEVLRAGASVPAAPAP